MLTLLICVCFPESCAKDHLELHDSKEWRLLRCYTMWLIRVTRITEVGTTLAVTINRRCVHWLLVMANIPSSPIIVTLIMEALSSSETSLFTRATQRNIPEDTVLSMYVLFFSSIK
jgi:hypothetical protein